MKFLFLALLITLVALPSTIHAIHFSVNSTMTNKICLIIEANITGSFTYSNKMHTTTTVQFTVPEDGSTELNTDKSICTESAEKMQIDFVPSMKPVVPETETQQKWSIFLEFAKEGNGTDKRFKLQNYSLTVHYYDSMNASYENETIPYTYYKQDQFNPEWTANIATQNPNGFVCSQNQLMLNVNNVTTDSSLQFNKLKVLAFVAQDNADFKAGQAFEQCSMDVRTSDLVPIIVGACLAGLVIVVLIAYLIGRARAKRQGYASV